MQPKSCISHGTRLEMELAMTTMASTNTDRIEKLVTLRAPRTRVWRALTTAKEFGAWFGAQLDGTFREGATVRVQVTVKGYEHVKLEMFVERMDPERYFSYRWHPYAVDPKIDYSK